MRIWIWSRLLRELCFSCHFNPNLNACLIEVILGGQCYKCTLVYECERHRRGGRDGPRWKETVGSASSFIAVLMSPGTHRLETAVLFSPRPGQQILYSYWHTETHVHWERDTGTQRSAHTVHCDRPTRTHTQWSIVVVGIVEVEISPPF